MMKLSNKEMTKKLWDEATAHPMYIWNGECPCSTLWRMSDDQQQVVLPLPTLEESENNYIEDEFAPGDYNSLKAWIESSEDGDLLTLEERGYQSNDFEDRILEKWVKKGDWWIKS